MYPIQSLLIASTLLLVVAGWDIARRRIPNWVNASLALTGLSAQVFCHGGSALLSGAAAAAITLAVLWSPWSKGRLGGGDVKAVLSAAIWIGLPSLLNFYLYAAVAGGLAALFSFLQSSARARRDVAQNLQLVWLRVGLPDVPIRGGDGRVSVPFGAAAATAALLLLWWR
ncbi:MAG TPA: A24 family peptidase [Polyangia bacterium]|jgi:Flp pilus assembly protein protease CpaA|nr:A24 family peptidase [Polyangia bacterium]